MTPCIQLYRKKLVLELVRYGYLQRLSSIDDTQLVYVIS